MAPQGAGTGERATGAAAGSPAPSPGAGTADTAIGEPEEVTPSSGLEALATDDDAGTDWLTVAEIGAAAVFVVSLAAVFGWPALRRRIRA